jgi:gas vesicle protein GvpL/GvpF
MGSTSTKSTQTQTAKYVYGVIRPTRKAAPRVRGIGRKQVRIVRADGIGALTSDVPPGDLKAGKDELLAHSRVLEKAIEQGTVLPMRFGVVMPNESAVRDQLLEPHRRELEEQLEQMDGKVEVNIKAIYDEAALLTEVIRERPEIGRLREEIRGQPEDATHFERIRLGELIAESVNQKRDADGTALVDRLGSHAAAVEVGDPVHERMAVNASFLIDRSELKAFDADLDRIAEEQGGRIRFRYTGPLAPHSFVELAMEG